MALSLGIGAGIGAGFKLLLDALVGLVKDFGAAITSLCREFANSLMELIFTGMRNMKEVLEAVVLGLWTAFSLQKVLEFLVLVLLVLYSPSLLLVLKGALEKWAEKYS